MLNSFQMDSRVVKDRIDNNYNLPPPEVHCLMGLTISISCILADNAITRISERNVIDALVDFFT